MASKTNIRKLDAIFSKFIRARDTGHDNTFVCCSCSRVMPYEQADAGHFINRRFMRVRWDERNVHAQCRSCNRFSEGNQVGYFRFMQKKYGDEVIDLLQALKNQPHKWTDFELEILIKEYQQKLKNLT